VGYEDVFDGCEDPFYLTTERGALLCRSI
jgi:hypothetical protein